MEKLFKKLKEVGFSEYEAKAYLTLLQHNPSNGYEVSKSSGVPRSMIYQTLQKLQSKGAVIELASSPVKYVPADYKELLKIVQTRMDETLSNLSVELAAYSKEQHADYFWNIRGYEDCLEKARQIINSAQTQISIYGWNTELNRLSEEIIQIAAKGIELTVLSNGIVAFPIKNVYYTEQPDLKSGDDRFLIIMSDEVQMMIAERLYSPDSIGLYTKNFSLRLLSNRFIKQEIFLAQRKLSRWKE